jgi:hypothetical protein
MAEVKTIVCFANSRKISGRCIAGREWDGENFGKWVRPIGSTPKGELYSERHYGDGSEPKLLDVIELGLLGEKPRGCHVEDQLVEPGRRWRKLGTISEIDAVRAIDISKGPLWIDGDSSSNGVNDRISPEEAEKLNGSLLLVQPAEVTLILSIEGAYFGNPRRRVRAHFEFDGTGYVIAVTDPVIEREFANEVSGAAQTLYSPLLCVSISEIFEKQNAHYKLVAGIIR